MASVLQQAVTGPSGAGTSCTLGLKLCELCSQDTPGGGHSQGFGLSYLLAISSSDTSTSLVSSSSAAAARFLEFI